MTKFLLVISKTFQSMIEKKTVMSRDYNVKKHVFNSIPYSDEFNYIKSF